MYLFKKLKKDYNIIPRGIVAVKATISHKKTVRFCETDGWSCHAESVTKKVSFNILSLSVPDTLLITS